MGWLRFQIIKDGGKVRLYSATAPSTPTACQTWSRPSPSSDISGNPRWRAVPDRPPQMRTSHPDESQLMFLAFDLLHQDGVDLRGLPLTERKRDLTRLCRQSRVPFVNQVQTFPDGAVLFDHCNRFGSKASCPSAWRRAIGAGQAATGSRRSAQAGSASIRGAIACSRVRASPS